MRLSSIVWLREHDYEVTFDVEGTVKRCVCTVLTQRGVRVVQAEPDFLATMGVSPRLIAAAVVAVDSVNE